MDMQGMYKQEHHVFTFADGVTLDMVRVKDTEKGASLFRYYIRDDGKVMLSGELDVSGPHGVASMTLAVRAMASIPFPSGSGRDWDTVERGGHTPETCHWIRTKGYRYGHFAYSVLGTCEG
jgi:hypothetical protein